MRGNARQCARPDAIPRRRAAAADNGNGTGCRHAAEPHRGTPSADSARHHCPGHPAPPATPGKTISATARAYSTAQPRAQPRSYSPALTGCGPELPCALGDPVPAPPKALPHLAVKVAAAARAGRGRRRRAAGRAPDTAREPRGRGGRRRRKASPRWGGAATAQIPRLRSDTLSTSPGLRQKNVSRCGHALT